MNIDVGNEFARDYAGEIALECSRMENNLRVGLEEYDSSALLLGKSSWYSVGLESEDGDQAKDSANKRNILLRIIDGVVNFIKMVGKKIAEWYKVCKAAILKFFGSEKVDPRQVSTRLDTLVAGMSPEDGKKLNAKFSQETKAFLAEVLNKQYSDAFYALYAEFRKIKDKCGDASKFSQNHEFFTSLKEKFSELKTIATANKIYENADTSLQLLLVGRGEVEKVAHISEVFYEISGIHDTNVDKLERLLKKIPNEDLDGIEGSNVDAKRRDAVKLISDIIKIESDLVLKVNNHMQAVSMLMTYIVKYRSTKLAFISM